MDINKLINILADLNPSTEQLSKLFKKYNLSYLLPAIQKSAEKLVLKEELVNQNRLLSPFNLDHKVINKIEEKYNIKISNTEIREDLVAGYKLYTRSKVIDNSLSNIIKKIN